MRWRKILKDANRSFTPRCSVNNDIYLKPIPENRIFLLH